MRRKDWAGADCMCTLFSAASVSEGLFFLKKNEDKSQVSVADDLAVREAIYKS